MRTAAPATRTAPAPTVLAMLTVLVPPSAAPASAATRARSRCSVRASSVHPWDHTDFCYLPSVCGNCKALFIRFFYNVSSQQCEEFIYGGCGGNRNNFETMRECSQACSHVSSQLRQRGSPQPLPRGEMLPAPRLSAPGTR
ncbi:hypothetical protein ASZ78_010564 [Callipepla squamata]|uniref:BPTI/Kunitz inhibitor domain-containing protein n=1 Tax=Callipepla squamata TaxID=9009 RepID=A0A226MQS2_CALSU|nr:hypothetical protein ASZ78_010564 [Callipepla squamata]